MSLHEAEARLAEMEGPRQRFHNARHVHHSLKEKLKRAPGEFPNDPEVVEAIKMAHDRSGPAHDEAKAAHDAHAHAFREKGVDLDREIDNAAQAVIDARAEPKTGEQG